MAVCGVISAEIVPTYNGSVLLSVVLSVLSYQEMAEICKKILNFIHLFLRRGAFYKRQCLSFLLSVTF